VSLDIWTVLLMSEDSLSLSELADRTGRAKSSVHGALAKMLERSEVVRDGDDYRIRVAETDCGGDGA
jgi:DNA-binding IclR family transcriptional regulator